MPDILHVVTSVNQTDDRRTSSKLTGRSRQVQIVK